VCRWGGVLQMVSEPLPNLRWGKVHKPMKVASGGSLGRQEWANPMRVLRGVIVAFHIAWVWRWGYAYMYIYTLNDNNAF
jgi:hypothetical protein